MARALGSTGGAACRIHAGPEHVALAFPADCVASRLLAGHLVCRHWLPRGASTAVLGVDGRDTCAHIWHSHGLSSAEADCVGEAAEQTALGIAARPRASLVRGGAEALACPHTKGPIPFAVATNAVLECTLDKRAYEGEGAQLAAQTMQSSSPRCLAVPAFQTPAASLDLLSGAPDGHLVLARTKPSAYRGRYRSGPAGACAEVPALTAQAGTTETPRASRSHERVQYLSRASPASSRVTPSA